MSNLAGVQHPRNWSVGVFWGIEAAGYAALACTPPVTARALSRRRWRLEGGLPPSPNEYTSFASVHGDPATAAEARGQASL
jgi:hypothetical protein